MSSDTKTLGSSLNVFNPEKPVRGQRHTAVTMLGKEFHTRIGPDYEEHGRKAASGPVIYECIGCDLFYKDTKIHRIGNLIDFEDEKEAADLFLPMHIVVNNMMPLYAPEISIFGDSPEDGEGYSLVFYLRLSEQALALLQGYAAKENELPTSFHLLRRFIDATANMTDEDRHLTTSRLKAICRIGNMEEVEGLNSAVKVIMETYNGKPFIIRDSSTFYRSKTHWEIGVDVHRFSYPARAALHGLKDVVNQGIFEYAYVIQGNDNAELPEQVFACIRVCYLDLERAVRLPNAISLTPLTTKKTTSTNQTSEDVPKEEGQDLP